MSRRATLIASLTSPPDAEELAALAGHADIVELRADLTGDIAAERLRAHFPGRLLYTLRSAVEGGGCEILGEERARRLVAAQVGFDLVDLEMERDLGEAILAAVAPSRRLLSWHGRLREAPELPLRLRCMLEVEAAVYKLVPAVQGAARALWVLDFLADAGRADVVAFAAGPEGAWSRLLSPRLGAPLVYAAAGPTPAAPGQMSITALERDFGMSELPPLRRLFGVVGAPVEHSLSPRLHNGLYRLLDIEALYLPFHVEEFGDFWLELVEGEDLDRLGFGLGGLSVTTPHKGVALAVAGATSPLAERVGAANILVRRRGVWEAETTDPEGVVGALDAAGFALRGARAAVIGVGGAGRAAAVGLAERGARVCLVNRTIDRLRRVGERLGLSTLPLADLEPGRFDLLVNATPLGRDPDDPLPFEAAGLGSAVAVVDMVYSEGRETPLLETARRGGSLVVGGREVLLHQALPQFRSMTGHHAPVDEARALLDLAPPSRDATTR